MQPATRREWALIAAFILYMVFAFGVHSYVVTDGGKELTILIYTVSVSGCLFGGLALPFILPLKELRHGQCPSRYKLKLYIPAFLVLSANFFYLLTPQVFWLARTGLIVFTFFANGVGAVFILGCFFNFPVKNRVFWAGLSLSAGLIVFFLIRNREYRSCRFCLTAPASPQSSPLFLF
jgi:hypothetical protein